VDKKLTVSAITAVDSENAASESALMTKTKVYGALIAVQLFFSVHYFAAKQVMVEIPPPVWAALRVTAAAVIMMVICLPRARQVFPKTAKDWGTLAVFSVFGVIINQICFTEGLARSVPTHSAIINSIIPISTLLFAILLRKESFTVSKLLCILLSLSGVLTILKVDQLQIDNQYFWGDLLTLTNALSFSCFLVMSKRFIARYEAFATTAIILSFGAIGILAYSFTALLKFDPRPVSFTSWELAAFIVIFPTVLAYFFNYWALKRVESSLVAFFIYLQPTLSAIIAVSSGREKFTTRMAVSAMLIFSGFFVSYITSSSVTAKKSDQQSD
jgi:drug/metabolite transporter (DMT)-like permease